MKDFQKYIIQDSATIKDALIALNNLSSDVLTLFVLNNEGCMVGTVTDGDIRRKLVDGYTLDNKVNMAMHTKFQYIKSNGINVNEIKRLRNDNITLVPCLDSHNRIVRIINLRKRKSILPLDAVLMAGGKGERLRPLTEKTPKPLLKVGEKSIIDYNIDRLIEFGVENISVTVNYLKEQIEDHFKDCREGIKINCVREPSYLGTIGSIQFIENIHNDTILLMNSDLFTNINYEDFYLHFINNDADMSVAAVPYSVNVPYGIFELNGRDIQGIREKPSYNYYANAGIYLIKKKHLALIPKEKFFNATDFIELLINKGHKVIRFPLTGYWIDIGKHEDYKKAQDLIKHL
ncbi:MAG: nucleotidyltransferase family protein [Parabacteroides sp.]|nr:nucleotidyltransferase family protein [Parabacteroides sp.]MDD3508471.1 nucleotidyltransferase family protein [Parabacteroides sp.]